MGLGAHSQIPNCCCARSRVGREALRSSSLEGTYATPQELLLFELAPQKPEAEGDPANSWLEVSNYSKSLRLGMKELNSIPFCLKLIHDLHRTLLTGVGGREKMPGEFRKTQVHIGSDFRFNPPPPQSIDDCLNHFEMSLNEPNPPYDPLVWCYLVHYQFETIHPFLDGNGRVGRALLSLMIFRYCKLSMPWLYMSAYFERYKDEYLDNLFQVSARAAWDAWIEFCLRGTITEAQDSIRRCDKLRKLREEFLDKVANAGPRAHAIVERLFTSPVVTVPSIAARHDVTYPTAKSDIDSLVKLGVLKALSKSRPKAFYASRIFAIAYREDGE